MENTEHSTDEMGTAPAVNPLQVRQGLGHAAPMKGGILEVVPAARDQEALPGCQALECVKLLKSFFDERRKTIIPRRKIFKFQILGKP